MVVIIVVVVGAGVVFFFVVVVVVVVVGNTATNVVAYSVVVGGGGGGGLVGAGVIGAATPASSFATRLFDASIKPRSEPQSDPSWRPRCVPHFKALLECIQSTSNGLRLGGQSPDNNGPASVPFSHVAVLPHQPHWGSCRHSLHDNRVPHA